MLARKAAAEVIGTFVLVLGGCGTAVFMGGEAGGMLGIALAFGLSVVAMAYAVGHISGCHLNPAVTLGLFAAGRHPAKEVPVYIGAQVVGAILGALVIMLILKNTPSVTPGGESIDRWAMAKAAGFASNGFDQHSPARFTMMGVLIAEAVLTFVFLFVILGATESRAPAAMGGLVVGLTLTLIHLISIPISNTSVNPARSTSQALFGPAWAREQLWLFWVAPIVGGILAGLVYPLISNTKKA